MRRIELIFVILLSMLALTAKSQSVPEFFRLGQSLMQQNSLTAASGMMFNSGFTVTPAKKGIVLAKNADSDIRLASRERNSQQVDTVRMELRTNKNVGQLTSEMMGLGFMFVEARNNFVSYQRDAIKVAVFNPYNYKDYKIAFVFARDPNVASPVAVQPAQPAQPSAPANTSDYETITVKGVSFKMIKVEGGSFMMGSNDGDADEKPVHQVTLSTFYIGETEVTQELWLAVMGKNRSKFKGTKRPVEKVSWDDCQEFVQKLNVLTGKTFRLPTEAEWEYAARGGNRSKGYTYSGSDVIDNVAWYEDNSGDQTHEVATKQPNELGIYDMSGNVVEWVQDRAGLWKGPKKYEPIPQTNPQGPSSGSDRVYRGGGWDGSAGYCRVSDRGSVTPSIRVSNLGLRLAY